MTDLATDHLAPRETPRPPAALRIWPAAFFLLTIGLGAGLTLASNGARDFPAGPSVRTGQWMAAYEKTLDAGVPWRDPAVRLWAGANFHLFGEAREGALVGTGGWLYTAEEFQTPPGGEVELRRKIDFVLRVRDQLAGRGARLMVAVVPAKTRIYPEHLRGQRVPPEKQRLAATFRAALRAAGVPAPDLEPALRAAKAQGPVFLRTDTHWTPLGAQVAAQTIAAAARPLMAGLDLPPATFRTTLGPVTQRSGDLRRYLPVAGPDAPAPDQLRTPVTERTDAGGGGLLGSAEIGVTLVGTSYSANATWNFDGALKTALGTDVLNAAKEGQGPMRPMRAYLISPDRRDNPPRLVVWEIPERFLNLE